MAAQPWRTGKIIRIENETASTKKFWVQIPELERFDFRIFPFTNSPTSAGEAIPSHLHQMEPMFLN